MNLGDQSGQDQPGLLKQPIAIPVRIVDLQAIADGVVLAGKQRMQGGQTDPPVAVHPGEFELALLAVHATIRRPRQ